MEDAMCYSRDYKIVEDQQKAATQLRQERQASVLDTMLKGANRQGDKAMEAPRAKDVAPTR